MRKVIIIDSLCQSRRGTGPNDSLRAVEAHEGRHGEEQAKREFKGRVAPQGGQHARVLDAVLDAQLVDEVDAVARGHLREC